MQASTRRSSSIYRRAADHPVSLHFPEGAYLKGLDLLDEVRCYYCTASSLRAEAKQSPNVEDCFPAGLAMTDIIGGRDETL